MPKQFDKPEVLLVYPGKKTDRYSIPLSLLYIAQALRQLEIKVRIFDMRKNHIRNLPLRHYLFAGITMMTGGMIKHGLRVAKLVKKHDPRIPIVLGGVHPSLLPDQTLENELVDIVVIGEGEETVKDLAICLLDKNDLSRIKGIAYKDENKKITINPRREFIDLNETDIVLPYNLLGINLRELYGLPVHTSRGCPYRCGFCYNQSFHKGRFRYKKALRVVDEVEYLIKRFNIHNFNFAYEDEFFANPKRVCEICELILKRGLKISWGSFCRFDSFDKIDNESLELIKKAGCQSLLFGAESGSQRILDEVIKKGITREQIIRGVNRLKKANIRHLVSFMCCLPTETQCDLDATFSLIDELSENNPILYINGIFVFYPIPGTPLFDLVKKEHNFKVPNSLEEWGKYEMPRVSLPRITWHSPEYARRCRTIYMLLRYPFHNNDDYVKSYKAYKELAKTRTNYHSLYIFYMVGKIQRWRWKNKFFKFPIELLIFEKIKEMPFLRKIYRSIQNLIHGNKKLG